jgi:hypothetical protein
MTADKDPAGTALLEQAGLVPPGVEDRGLVADVFPWRTTMEGQPVSLAGDHDPETGEVLLTARIMWQHRPVAEVGKVGLQPEEALQMAVDRMNELNAEVPSVLTTAAIRLVESAIAALEARTADRVERGVEGTKQP